MLGVKNPPANAGDIREAGSIPGLGRSSREGHGNPPQYSCLENPIDRGTWRAIVHGVTKSQTQLKLLNMHTCTHVNMYVYTNIGTRKEKCTVLEQVEMEKK